MSNQYKNFIAGIGLIPNNADQNVTFGDVNAVNETNPLYPYQSLNFHNGSSSSPVLTIEHAAQNFHKILNKDFDDATTRIIGGPNNNPKALNFDLTASLSGTKTTLAFSQGTDIVLTFPNTTDTLVGRNTIDSLTNKTLLSPVLYASTADSITGIAGGDLSLQSSVGYKVIVEGLSFDGANVTGANISIASTGTLGLSSTTSSTLNATTSIGLTSGTTTNISAGSTLSLSGTTTSSLSAGTKLTLTGPTGVKVSGPLLVNEVIDSASIGPFATLPIPTSPYLTVTNPLLYSISGIVNNSDNEFIVVTNRTGVSINITNEEPVVTANNRIITGTGSFLTLDNNASIMLAYSNANSRWMVVGGTGGGNASVNLVAGETIAAGQAVYVSNGPAVDSGRTAGYVYLLDATNDNRVEFLGFASNAATAGNTIRIQTIGGLTGLSGLSVGKPVFASVTSVGGVQATAPVAVNQWVIPVGIATSATTAVINGAGSATALKITSSIVDGLYADVQSYSANTSITNANSVVFVSAASGVVTITIPAATANKGKIFNIKKTDSSLNGVIISPVSGTIDGAATKTLAFQYDALMLASDGSNYYLI